MAEAKVDIIQGNTNNQLILQKLKYIRIDYKWMLIISTTNSSSNGIELTELNCTLINEHCEHVQWGYQRTQLNDGHNYYPL